MTDTEDKRRAATGIVTPDGTISEFDRRTSAGVYPVGLGDDDGEGPATNGTVRQIVIAIDPELGLSGTYEWGDFADGNSDKAAFSCAYVPKTKTDAIGFLQDTVFMGTLNAGKTIQTFRDDLGLDDMSVLVDADLITSRLDPLLSDDTRNVETTSQKRFRSIYFPYVNPLEKEAEVQYSINAEAPQKGGAMWEDVVQNTGESWGGIEEVGDWINIRVRDRTQISNREVFSSFVLEYYNVGLRTRG